MIADIRLQNFRSYKDDTFEFGPGVNIIVGPNGSGKTNLLEAILVAAVGHSYRAKDIDLIKFKSPWARIEAHTAGGDSRVVKLIRNEESSQKEYKLNEQKFTRLDTVKILPVVVFEPEHLQLINGSPELRRQSVDDILEQIKPGYTRTRRDYRRTLAQRNVLLKRHQSAHQDQLFAWNIRLSELGSKIANEREAFIKSMNAEAQAIYNQLSTAKNTVVMSYTSHITLDNYGSDLLHKLEASLQKDYDRGFTTYGPHRDDVQIKLNNNPVQTTASRGEARTLLLVWKVLESLLLEEARGAKPILLFDDVFSELDGARRQALTAFIQPYQSFVTTTDADIVIQHFTEAANIIPIA